MILAPPALIQSDDASIKRRIVVYECGAYSGAALFNILLPYAALNWGRRLIE